MIFNVAGLLTAPVGTVRQHSIEDDRLVTEYGTFEEISGPVRMLRTDRTILVEADVDAVVEETCGRCLSPATVRLHVEIEEEFYPLNSDLVAATRSGAREDGVSDEATLINDRNVLDISEVVRQALLGSMPITPLCTSDCRGLCSVCAADRNVTECNCDKTPIDPRWGPLAGLSAQS